jgi:hypothetical protein
LGWWPVLDGGDSAFPGADPDCFEDVNGPDFAVAGPAVFELAMMTSRMSSACSFVARTSTRIFGSRSTLYSAPRYTSV